MPLSTLQTKSPEWTASAPNISICSERESSEWDSYVQRSPEATVSHVYGWRRIITAACGHPTFYLLARRGSRIVGVLPLIWLKSRFFGSTIASMPFQDYGGILADDPVAARALLDRALQLRNECGADCIELRHRTPMLEEEGLLRQDKVTLMLDISSDSENLWKTLSSKVRNQVRKAEKSGLSTHLGGAELLEEFYQVFAVNMRDLGSPVHHPDFFTQIFSQFCDRARLLVVRDGNRTIGGLIGLFFEKTMIVPWASCLREYFPKCPNNILYWKAFQIAKEFGCNTFDFGRSSIGSGTYNFKLQWGAKPVQLNWQSFYKKHQPAAVGLSENGKMVAAAKLWSHLPVKLTVLLGPAIRKYIAN